MDPRLGGLNERGPAKSPWSTNLASGPPGPDPTDLEAGPSRDGSAGLFFTGSPTSGLFSMVQQVGEMEERERERERKREKARESERKLE